MHRGMHGLFALIACPAAAFGQITHPAPEGSITRIVMLGTGTPNPDPDRSGPALAVVVGDTPYLVDCGPGVVRRAAAAQRRGMAALRVDNLKHLFMTHLHSDHTVGLPDLIFTPWVMERDEPLKVFGPPGAKNMIEHILAAYTQDIDIRLHGFEGAQPEGYKVDVHEIELRSDGRDPSDRNRPEQAPPDPDRDREEAGLDPATKPRSDEATKGDQDREREGAASAPDRTLVYSDAQVKVYAFRVNHGSWKHAYGFRFETPDRTIVISGDTAPSANLIENARGCDVLIHEVYSTAGFAKREPKWQRYHAAFHTSSAELADIAAQTRPGLLILTHQLFWGTTDEALVAEIAERYPGHVVSARDLDVY